MNKPLILVVDWLPEGRFEELVRQVPDCEFIDGRSPENRDRHLARAAVTYGLPPVARLKEAETLRWIQLVSAGVPGELCGPAKERGLTVTNLAGLYGPTIAEHALAMMLLLSRNLHTVLANQRAAKWDRAVAGGLTDLHGKTLAIVGLGNIGRNIARLARAFGMRVVGCRRTNRPTPDVDRVYPCAEVRAMLAEGDYVAVAAPLTPQTKEMLGPDEFRAMKRGAVFINVSRGGIPQEKALLEALQSAHLAAAGLDVFAVEPLSADHPFWTMPQVLVSPHYSGETVNTSAIPSERFARNLHSWLHGEPLEGVVQLDQGY